MAPRSHGEVIAMVAVAAGAKAFAWFAAGLALMRWHGAGATGVDFAMVGGAVSIALAGTLVTIALMLRYQRLYLYLAALVMAAAMVAGLVLLVDVLSSF